MFRMTISRPHYRYIIFRWINGWHLQHPAGWASAQGCSDWSPANGGASGVTCDACDVGGPPKPLLNASACNDSIKRLAAWRSASRSSAVCRLQSKTKSSHKWKSKHNAFVVHSTIIIVYYLLKLLKSQHQRNCRHRHSSMSEAYSGAKSINYSFNDLMSTRYQLTLWSEFSNMSTRAFRCMAASVSQRIRYATTKRMNVSTLNNSIKLWWCCFDDNSDKVYIKMQLSKTLWFVPKRPMFVGVCVFGYGRKRHICTNNHPPLSATSELCANNLQLLWFCGLFRYVNYMHFSWNEHRVCVQDGSQATVVWPYGTPETCPKLFSVKYIDRMPRMKGKWSDVAGERMNSTNDRTYVNGTKYLRSLPNAYHLPTENYIYVLILDCNGSAHRIRWKNT